MSFIIFLAVLSILVVVHEWGHFMAARKVGIRVEKFSLGFGPKLFSWNQGGTEFMLSLIPLGGYVKLAGDERAECKGTPEEFYSHPVGHRAAVIAMGPTINFLFAYICFYVIFVTGFPMLAPKIGKVMAGLPAQSAGILEGDAVLQINAVKVNSWEDIQKNIAQSREEQIQVKLKRGTETMTIAVNPQIKVLKTIFGKEEQVRIIGIQPKAEMIFQRFPWQESFGKALDQITGIVSLTFQALYHVVNGSMAARDAFAGPIRIFDVIKQAASLGLTSLVYIMAIISTSLAIFNLFPVPVLDGGHLFLLAVERIRRRPLSAKFEEGLTKLGFSLLMCLMVFVLYNDMLQVGWLDHIKGFVHALWQ